MTKKKQISELVYGFNMEKIAPKVGKISVDGGITKMNEEESRDMASSVCDFLNYKREQMFKFSKKRVINIPDLCGCEWDRLDKIAKRGGNRATIAKILMEKGKISRAEFKKYNEWGDSRFLCGFVSETIIEGELYYVLKSDVRPKNGDIQ